MRNAEATQEKILNAAFTEFARYGIAGARVDKIAASAKCNKNLIYIYFGNKEALFQKVLDVHLSRVYQEIEFSADDLPGYAMNVFDFAMQNPDLIRLLAWSRLECETPELKPQRSDSRDEKLIKIQSAQAAGALGNNYPPGFLLTTVMTLACAWAPTSPFAALDPDAAHSPDNTREQLGELVKALTAPK